MPKDCQCAEVETVWKDRGGRHEAGLDLPPNCRGRALCFVQAHMTHFREGCRGEMRINEAQQDDTGAKVLIAWGCYYAMSKVPGDSIRQCAVL